MTELARACHEVARLKITALDLPSYLVDSARRGIRRNNPCISGRCASMQAKHGPAS
jgi:hypothetical protein